MALVTRHSGPAHPAGGLRDWWPHHPGFSAALAVAGLAVALLVGHDGTLGWQVVRVIAVVALTATLVVTVGRLGDRACGRIAVAVGAVLLAIGLGFLPHAIAGLSPQAVAGVTVLVAGLVLVAAGAVRVARGRGVIRRIATGAVALVITVLVAVVVGPAVAATNAPHQGIGATPASEGLSYESLTLATTDGELLAAWYVPSTNRAAVVLLHGAGSTRSNVLDEAAVLARHGFGVLMIDARGHGDSTGRAMDFGWYGDTDIAAATKYLTSRHDVDRHRIGVVGMSMGGEEALGASATDEAIGAVVAEGATTRVAADEAWLSDEFGVRGLAQEQLERLQDLVTDALTSASVPTAMRDAVGASDNTRYLLITAEDMANEGNAAAFIASGAPERVEVWTVPGAGHTEGLQTAPEEWEARVVGFLEDSLIARG